ncbi:YhfC family intramembrane metalloprotease [Lacticaseibacillus chiayiensis]|uniref:YhfC family intramembrane metalloprotease n=1 Tax=Lacticaseibacillus chiayiensis TaxID=2100821 RepID=UPI003C794C9F
MSKILNSTVSQSTIVMMVIEIIICLFLPIALAVWIIKRRSYPEKGSTPVFFIGMAIFVLFAGILEDPFRGIARQFQHTPWLYALYGALLAGVFEEVGRWFGFKWIQRRIPQKAKTPETPFLYGLGHGGIEMMLGGGLAMFSNVLFAMTINSGALAKLMTKTPTSARAGIVTAVKQLTGMSGWTVSLSLLERLLALTIQIALSLVVWLIVVNRKQWFWMLMPVGLHAFIDFPAALSQTGALSVTVTELLLVVQTVIVVAFVYWLWRREKPSSTVSA